VKLLNVIIEVKSVVEDAGVVWEIRE